VTEVAPGSQSDLTLTVNGKTVVVDPERLDGRGPTLLEVLREQLGLLSVKDGCSPQGQCGCCTVLVDGEPRVACVTPARRVKDRAITTFEGLEGERADRWADSFCVVGASQCGFCTPGIIMRLEGAARASGSDADVDQALLAHLCRCTGWRTIHEAWDRFHDAGEVAADLAHRKLSAAGRRATIEGGAPQRVGPEIARGHGGFAADTAPADALIAVRADDGSWVTGERLAAARAEAGKVQGRRTTAAPAWPLDVPDGEWDVALRTTWVDSAYLETDASWCRPGEEPYTTVANGGAFGAKRFPAPSPAPSTPSTGSTGSALDVAALDVASAARRLADEHGRPVLALASREDVARFGAKRPPLAAGMMDDGRAHVRVVDTPGIVEAILGGFARAGVDPSAVRVETVTVPGPPTSAGIRAAGWAEVAALVAGVAGSVGTVRSPSGAEAEAEVDVAGGRISVAVSCGPILDDVVLRSYCIGAAHMAWSWLTSESLAVDNLGVVHDLTVRSFGVLRAVDTPRIDVELRPGQGEPVNGSDAVFAAVAAAGWLATGRPRDWPAGFTPPSG
jgi:aerobic-type carbon monoxide dehydrogenase small subunit (CoxS/CutS family)